MPDHHPLDMPTSVTPMATSHISLPGAWPPEPAATAATAPAPPVAAHSGRAVASWHRERASTRALKNLKKTHGRSRPHPSDSAIPAPASTSYGAQQSNFSPVEENVVCFVLSEQSAPRRHPYLQLSPHKIGSNRLKAEEALHDTRGCVPPSFLKLHASRVVSKNGSWTKKEVEQFRKRLEAVYERHVENEKQVAIPTPVHNTSPAATMDAPRRYLYRQKYPPVTTSQMSSCKPYGSRIFYSVPVFIETPEPAAKNQQLSGQALAGTRNMDSRHTEAAPTSRSSMFSGSSTNDMAKNSSFTPGLAVDAVRSKDQAYIKCRRPEPRRATQVAPYTRHPGQQNQDSFARHKRNNERRRLASQLHAEALSSTANSKATAELHQITEDMQNMKITHVGTAVSTPSVRHGSRLPNYLDAVAQHQRVDPTATAPSPMKNNVLFATKRSLFDSDSELNDSNPPRRSKFHKGRKGMRQHPYWLRFTERISTAGKLQMRELRRQFLFGRSPTPESPTSFHSNPKNEQRNVQEADVYMDARPEAYHEMSREDSLLVRHPNDDAVPELLRFKPAPIASSIDEDRMDLSSQSSLELPVMDESLSCTGDDMDLDGPLSPRSSSPANGTFTDIPLSSSPQSSLEIDFAEVDAGDVDDLEWEMICR